MATALGNTTSLPSLAGNPPSASMLLNAARTIVLSGVTGAIYDVAVLNSLWEDSARTTPASINGPVGAMDDLSGNGFHQIQATTAKKPILRTGGGLYWLEADGTDDSMRTVGSINCTSVDKAFLAMGVRQDSSTVRVLIEANQRLGINGSGTNAGDWSFNNFNGTTTSFRTTAGASVPRLSTLFCQIDIAGANADAEILPRVNGAVPGFTTINNDNETGNLIVNDRLDLLARADAAFFFQGRFYCGLLTARSTVATAAEIATIEQWAAARSGVILP